MLSLINPAIGDAFVIVNNDGADAVIGTFSGLPEGHVLTVQAATSESLSGTFSITYHGGDGNDVVLTAVNTAPTFVVGADQIASHDSGPQTIASWATNISPGRPSEAGQQLHFVVIENTNPGLFAALPAIYAAGNLTFSPAQELNGSAQITIALSDDGGTANGGEDTSPPQTFTIYVVGPNRWHNTTRPMDVNGDGQRTAGDALELINFLNAFGAGPVPSAAEFPLPYYDVSNDEFIAANDALDIINHLNAYGPTLAPTAGPEGEAANLAAANSASDYGSDPDWLVMVAEDVASSAKRRRQ
jgi:hypothetical protein